MGNPSKVFIQDVSFAGSEITLSGGPFGRIGVKVVDFMDDQNPVEFQDVEVTSVGVNLNGAMIRNARPNTIMASITVIPLSDNDRTLYEGWQQYRVAGSFEAVWEDPLTLTIDVGNQSRRNGRVGKFSFSNGTMVSGPGGPVSNAEGKMMGRTYSFAFVTVD